MATASLQPFSSANRQQSNQLDEQTAINWYAIQDTETKKWFMAPTSGTEQKTLIEAAGTAQKGRASFQTGEFMYQVCGNTVFQVDSNLSATEIGELTTESGYIGICSNGQQILFVDGAKGWVYDIALDSFDEIPRTGTSAGFPLNPVDCAFLQGFFFVVQGESNLFFQSGPGSPMKWSPANFALANSEGDILIAIRTVNNRLFLFSTISTSVWENQGQAGFSFREDPNFLFNFGSYTAKSTAVDEGEMFFFGRTSAGVGDIYHSNGGTPTIISTSAINVQLAKLNNPNDAEGFVYKENGNIFYQISFTADQKSFVYSMDSGKWHTRQMLDAGRHIATSYCFYKDKAYILSYKDNYLYEMGPDILTDNGDPIFREITLPVFTVPGQKCFRVDKFKPIMQSGVGLNGNPIFWDKNYAQGADPQVYLLVSRNCGATFGNEHQASMGRIGEYDRRIVFRKLGRTKPKSGFVPKLRVYDPVKTYYMGSDIDYTVASK